MTRYVDYRDILWGNDKVDTDESVEVDSDSRVVEVYETYGSGDLVANEEE